MVIYCGRRFAKRLIAAMICIIFATSATAEIFVDQAMITSGELRVSGRIIPSREATITLDDIHRAQVSSEGRFLFRLAYHPANCIVTLKVNSDSRQAVIGFCGQRGQVGPIGPAPVEFSGRVGPQGPQGAQGIAGHQGPQGAQGNQGSQGEPGSTGPIGLTGSAGLTGPVGGIGPVGHEGKQGPGGLPGPTGPEGKAGTQSAALRVFVENCKSGGRCVARCNPDEYAINGTCDRNDRLSMDESNVYCVAAGDSTGPTWARAICARKP